MFKTFVDEDYHYLILGPTSDGCNWLEIGWGAGVGHIGILGHCLGLADRPYYAGPNSRP